MFDRLYELLSDSGFLDIAYPVVIVISVVALVITIFNFIKITIRSITNTKKKDEDDIKFGEQIGEAFERFGAVIGLTLFVSILSVPVFLIIRKVLQLLGQFIDWLLV